MRRLAKDKPSITSKDDELSYEKKKAINRARQRLIVLGTKRVPPEADDCKNTPSVALITCGNFLAGEGNISKKGFLSLEGPYIDIVKDIESKHKGYPVDYLKANLQQKQPITTEMAMVLCTKKYWDGEIFWKGINPKKRYWFSTRKADVEELGNAHPLFTARMYLSNRGNDDPTPKELFKAALDASQWESDRIKNLIGIDDNFKMSPSILPAMVRMFFQDQLAIKTFFLDDENKSEKLLKFVAANFSRYSKAIIDWVGSNPTVAKSLVDAVKADPTISIPKEVFAAAFKKYCASEKEEDIILSLFETKSKALPAVAVPVVADYLVRTENPKVLDKALNDRNFWQAIEFDKDSYRDIIQMRQACDNRVTQQQPVPQRGECTKKPLTMLFKQPTSASTSSVSSASAVAEYESKEQQQTISSPLLPSLANPA